MGANYHELRERFRIESTMGEKRVKSPRYALIIPFIYLAILLLVNGCGGVVMAKERINDQKSILSIIGEAEGELYTGKLALSYALINRGTLKGVFGLRSARVKAHKYSDKTYMEAKRSWEYANTHPEQDITNGATGWGNANDMKLFNETKWFSKCYVTKKIGNHFFYACKG